jgi:hypothetical protein
LNKQIQSAATSVKITEDFLSNCPSDLYVIVSQPNANAADYKSSFAVPQLRRMMGDAAIKTKVTVSEVVGAINPNDLEAYISSTCDALVEKYVDGETIPFAAGKPLVVRVDFSSLPRKELEREAKLANNGMTMPNISMVNRSSKTDKARCTYSLSHYRPLPHQIHPDLHHNSNN